MVNIDKMSLEYEGFMKKVLLEPLIKNVHKLIASKSFKACFCHISAYGVAVYINKKFGLDNF